MGRSKYCVIFGLTLVLAGGDQISVLSRARADEKVATELERLRKQVQEQQALIIHLIEVDRQRSEMLLKALRGNGSRTLPWTQSPVTAAPTESQPDAAATIGKKDSRTNAADRTSFVTGKLTVDGAMPADVYVYVRNVRGAVARDKTVQIVQKDKRFVPETLVVQRGTKVSFPNMDAVYHNVFSPSPAQPFDLGIYRADDPVRSQILLTPGVVDIYCNMHSRMRASILVVPNALYTKVGPGGSFRIDRVPLGRRELVFWSPSTSPATVVVEVRPEGATANAQIKTIVLPPHNNKLGRPYPQYE